MVSTPFPEVQDDPWESGPLFKIMKNHEKIMISESSQDNLYDI